MFSNRWVWITNVWYVIKYVASTTENHLTLSSYMIGQDTLVPNFHMWLENNDCTDAQYPCWILKKPGTNIIVVLLKTIESCSYVFLVMIIYDNCSANKLSDENMLSTMLLKYCWLSVSMTVMFKLYYYCFLSISVPSIPAVPCVWYKDRYPCRRSIWVVIQ